MTIRSPGRFITFLSVLAIAVVLMFASEWRFITEHKSATCTVIGLSSASGYKVRFQEEDGQTHDVHCKDEYGFPNLDWGDRRIVRYTINANGQIDQAHLYWAWTMFANRWIALAVACLPWYAFVWSMPAKWAFRIGGRRGIDFEAESQHKKDRKRLGE